ncbi:HTTM domain-containing protein, partial [bacterium]|nr:HTTM domain-containing protein [bacterium]
MGNGSEDGRRRASPGGALMAPVDVAPLVFFRIAFGVLLAWHLLDYLQYGWARRVYVDPVLRVPHSGFEWLSPWPGEGMLLHFSALLAAAVAFAAGRWTRLASWALFLGLTYTFLLERTHSNNHDYLIVLLAFLACWLPLGRAGS